MDSTYMTNEEERGLRAAGLDELANYQLAVHNPQSALHEAANSDRVRRNIRDYLDVDYLTSLKLADYIIGEIRPPLAINEAIASVTRYEPYNKLFLKRNLRKMKEESTQGAISERHWPGDHNYRRAALLIGDKPPPMRVVGGSIARPRPRYSVYRKKHPLSYKDKNEVYPKGYTASVIRSKKEIKNRK
jgi:hypothetical protein